jgi:hypothetical protein
VACCVERDWYPPPVTGAEFLPAGLLVAGGTAEELREPETLLDGAFAGVFGCELDPLAPVPDGGRGCVDDGSVDGGGTVGFAFAFGGFPFAGFAFVAFGCVGFWSSGLTAWLLSFGVAPYRFVSALIRARVNMSGLTSIIAANAMAAIRPSAAV